MSFFNIVNPRIAQMLGTPIIPEYFADQSLWGGVTTTHLNAWNSALHDLYEALYFAGYEPDTVQFRVTNSHVVSLNLDSGELSTITDADSRDIVLSFTPIWASLPGWAETESISIPLSPDIAPEMAGYTAFPVDFLPSLSLDASGGIITMQVFGLIYDFDGDGSAEAATYSDRTHPDYAGLGVVYTADLVRYHVEAAVYARWFAAQASDARDIAERDLWDSGQFEVHDNPQDAKPLDNFAYAADGSDLPGLMWVLNPAVWTYAPGVEPPKRLIRIATRIWNKFLDLGLSTPRRTGHVGKTQLTMAFDAYSALARRTLGMHKIRAKRFMNEVDTLITLSGVAFSDTVRLGLRGMPYLEVIMVLVNFGVIRIEGLGEFAFSETDEDRDPLEFYRFQGERDAFDLHLFGAPAAVLEYDTELTDYRSDPGGATPYPLEALVAWEFHENTIYNGFDPIPGEPPKHRLVIVAAPGVRVQTIDLVGVIHQVIRVQDPLFVPRLFTQIDTDVLLSAYQMYTLPPGEELVPDVAEVLAEPPEEDITDGGDTGFPGDTGLPGDTDVESGGALEVQVPTDSGEIDAFNIRPEEDGVTIEFPAASFALANRDIEYFSLLIRLKVDKTAGNQRFAFDIRPTAQMREILEQGLSDTPFEEVRQYELVIHKTPGVEVELSTCSPAKKTVIGHREEFEPFDWVRFFIYDVVPGNGVDLLNCVQPPDADFAYDPGHRTSRLTGGAPGETSGYLPDAASDFIFGGPLAPISNYRLTPSQSVPHGQLQFVGIAPGKFTNLSSPGFVVRLLFDVGIGFIPVVGTATDIAEIVGVMATGRDRWGDPVSNTQFVLMVGCAALPLVSTGAAKALARGAL